MNIKASCAVKNVRSFWSFREFILQFKPRRMEAAWHKHLILRWPILHAPCCAVSGAAACEQWDAIIALCAHSQLAYYRVWNICRFIVFSLVLPQELMSCLSFSVYGIVWYLPYHSANEYAHESVCTVVCERAYDVCCLKTWFSPLSHRLSRQQACQAYT